MKKKIAFISLLFISIAALLGVVALRQRIIKPKAANKPVLSFTATAPTAPCDFEVVAGVSPDGVSFNAFNLSFTFDDTKIGLCNPSDVGSNFEKMFDSAFPLSKISLTGNKIFVEGAKDGTAFPPSSPSNLIKIKMLKKAGATGTVNFSWDQATRIPNALDVTFQNADLPISGGAGSAKLYFSSIKTTPVYNPDENLDLELYLDTGKDASGNYATASSFQFDFNYDSAKVTFQNSGGSDEELAANNIVFNNSSGFTPFQIKVISSEKKIKLNGAVGANPAVTGVVKLATVKLKILPGTAGQSVSFTALDTSLVYDINTQNILGERPTFTVSIVELQDTPTPTSTPGGPTPTITLTPTPWGWPPPGFCEEGSCPTPTPRPTDIPRLPKTTPTGNPTGPFCPQTIITPPYCSMKSQGDANCDDKIDEADYAIWLNQFDTMVIPVNAGNVNNNANFYCLENDPSTHFVDLSDYEAWRRGRYPTPTP